MDTRKYCSRIVAILSAIALIPSLAIAQDDDPGFIQVRTMVVKPDRIADFMALQAEFAEADKAAGNSRDFWQEVRGDSNTYHAVRSLDKLGDNDVAFKPPMDQQAWSAWISRFQGTIASTSFQVLRIYPGHAIPAAEGSETNLMLLRYRTVAVGESGDYRQWIENDLLPAISEGGFKGFSYVRVHQGGNPNTWISAARYPNWMAMDEPGLFSHMSDRNRDSMLRKSSEMVVSSDVKVLSYNSGLSY
jgi:hypothetical protein